MFVGQLSKYNVIKHHVIHSLYFYLEFVQSLEKASTGSHLLRKFSFLEQDRAVRKVPFSLTTFEVK